MKKINRFILIWIICLVIVIVVWSVIGFTNCSKEPTEEQIQTEMTYICNSNLPINLQGNIYADCQKYSEDYANYLFLFSFFGGLRF